MAKNTPAFQFYPQDFLGGVMLLNNKEVGIYIKLLSALWISNNELPLNFDALARATLCTPNEFSQAWELIAEKFEVADKKVSHPRFTKMIELREIRQASGSLGGSSKASSKAPSKRLAKAKQTPSKVQKNEDRRMKNEERTLTTEKQSRYSTDFETFWKVYPPWRKNKKGECFKFWNRAIADGVSSLEIIEAAIEFAASPEGLSEFCPSPSPWLNGCRWEDERSSWQTSQSVSAIKQQDLPRSVKNEIAGRTMKEAAREQYCKQQRIEGTK